MQGVSIEEIIVSADIEADGPIPPDNSMLSLASAAYKIENGRYDLVDTFSANLLELPGAVQDPATMKWWDEHPEAWRACRSNILLPEDVMRRYYDWLKSLGGEVAIAAWPIAYDFMFVYYYLMKFIGKSPFGHNGPDIRTYAWAMLKRNSWKNFSMEETPERWWVPNNFPHLALEDAKVQGESFCRMIIENLST